MEVIQTEISRRHNSPVTDLKVNKQLDENKENSDSSLTVSRSLSQSLYITSDCQKSSFIDLMPSASTCSSSLKPENINKQKLSQDLSSAKKSRKSSSQTLFKSQFWKLPDSAQKQNIHPKSSLSTIAESPLQELSENSLEIINTPAKVELHFGEYSTISQKSIYITPSQTPQINDLANSQWNSKDLSIINEVENSSSELNRGFILSSQQSIWSHSEKKRCLTRTKYNDRDMELLKINLSDKINKTEEFSQSVEVSRNLANAIEVVFSQDSLPFQSQNLKRKVATDSQLESPCKRFKE
ncbi:unnamed protein product [Blepharisma stoltei]|uniref:Uncharacterized protein n=1 Tax=Blepharisma stoltei TaxID=1481888 RepID=A0AAU9JX78_9CILI|nr:unnamed protein product [Blepharisma stoltei]